MRTIIAEAKSVNMPADNIKRAIQRGTGELPGVSYEEVTYEAYGPGGAALIIEVLTDNRNRTVGELRHTLTKYGGNLGETNSVAWMFHKKGYIVIEKAKASEDALLAAALDAGADDLRDDGDSWEVVSPPDVFQPVLDAVKALGIETGRRRDRDAAAELREARRQAGAADGQADGHPRGPRGLQEGLVERRHRGKGDRGLVGVRIFGIDPGSQRTGYGCVERIGSRHALVICGSLSGPPRATFPDKLNAIHDGLTALLTRHRPDCVAIEDIFHARNVRSALKLGEARGVALLAASEAGVPVVSYAPGGDQARRRRLRPRREAPGAADGQAAARPRPAADAARRRRCAGGRALPSAVVDGSHPGRDARGCRQAAIRAAVLAGVSAVIALLRGSLIEKHPSRVVVDVGGVGYDVQVPLSTFYGLGEPGATVVLRIHTHVREDLIALYGFSTPLEQDLFERLIAISGIGPKLGLAVLSGHRAGRSHPRDPHAGRRATDEDSRRRQEDRRADRARAEGSAAGAGDAGGRPGPASGRPEDQLRDDLLSALVNLGYQSTCRGKSHRPRAQGVAGRGFRAGAA